MELFRTFNMNHNSHCKPIQYQVALCEEPGHPDPVEVPWNWKLRSLRQILAGHGNSFLVTKRGTVYSWGHGNTLSRPAIHTRFHIHIHKYMHTYIHT
jgi:hypothetical protein